MKRTCSGCIALSLEHECCELGYVTIRIDTARRRPIVNCEKPLTIKAFMRILDAREKRAEEAKDKKGLTQ